MPTPSVSPEAKSPSLSEQIITTLRERILHWQYPPLYRLTEDQICSEFGVSRSPAREALRVLETDGYLARMNNRGFVVKQLDLREVEELYELRAALELYAIQIVAENQNKSPQVEALKKVWRDVKNHTGMSADQLARLDVEFHETLAGLLGNRALDRQLKEINARLFAFRLIDFGKADRVAISVKEHLKVLERLNAADVDGSRSALLKNIEGSRSTARQSLMEALSKSFTSL